MTDYLNNVCLWYKVAQEQQGKDCKTFSEDSECLRCDGLNKCCLAYVTDKVLEDICVKDSED